MLKVKIGLSKRKKVPVFYILGEPFLPNNALHLLFRIRKLNIVDEDEKSIVIKAHGQQLKLLVQNLICLMNEWKVWQKYYLPNFSLQGKTVLDVGAGCGETAFLYFLHGARKVVAVEPNTDAVECLIENVAINKWNVEIIPEPFKLEHLEIQHDFMKMDGEDVKNNCCLCPKLTSPA